MKHFSHRVSLFLKDFYYHICYLAGFKSVGIDLVHCCGTVERGPPFENLCDLFRKCLPGSQCRPFFIPLDTRDNSLYGCFQPDNAAVYPQLFDILRALDHTTSGIDDNAVPDRHLSYFQRLPVTETGPAVPLDYLGDAQTGTQGNRLVDRDKRERQLLRYKPSHMALACTTITDQNYVHPLSRSISTFRITSTGASAPVNFSNCSTA